MSDKTTELLECVIKNAEMGKNTLRKLITVTKDTELKQELKKELAVYEDISRRAGAMMCVNGAVPKGQSRMAKMNTAMALRMGTARDASARHIAEMVIQGCQLGVIDAVKAQKCASDANCGAQALAKRLENAEQQYSQALQQFL